ncbi:MAG: hypothetical protein ACYTXE_43675 [Nostoc sp.]
MPRLPIISAVIRRSAWWWQWSARLLKYPAWWTGNCVAERRRLSPRLLWAIACTARVSHRH